MQRFRKSRRLMSVILTLLMLLSVCPLGAFADGEFTPDCKISLNNDGITVSEGFSLKTITTPANLIINCQVKGRPEEFLDATVGNTYLLTLPLSASYQAYSNTGGLIGAYQNHPLGGGKGHFAATTDPSKSHFGTHMVNTGKVNTKNDNYIVTKETLIEKGYSASDLTTQPGAQYHYYFIRSDANAVELGYVLLVERVDVSSVDMSELDELINLATSIRAEDYYTAEDRYNGRLASTNGFWSDKESALAAAQELKTDENAAAADIYAAITNLDNTLKNLIPITQVNTTFLYEAINACVVGDESLYNAPDWALYLEKKQAADALISEMFNGGVASEANKAECQEEIDAAAAALTQAYNALTIEIADQAKLQDFILFGCTSAKPGTVGTLSCDITLVDYATGLRTYQEKFNGVLDGNGHSIIIDSSFKGLFGLNYGVVKNLTIDAGETLVNPAAKKYLLVNKNCGIIENCRNKVSISYDLNYAPIGIGGICYQNDSSGIIRKCVNEGDVTTTWRGASEMAGICVRNDGLIESCCNSGSFYLASGFKMAGIAVFNNPTGVIKDSYNLGVLRRLQPFAEPLGFDYMVGTWVSDEESAVAPIVGKNEGSLFDCYYIDSIVKVAQNGRVMATLSGDFYTKAGIYSRSCKRPDRNVDTPFIANYVLPLDDTTFASGEYYMYYDATHGHFIAVATSADATTNVIDAAAPSEIKTTGRTYRGLMPGNGHVEIDDGGYLEKDIYLVYVPSDSTNVIFTNTSEIVDPTVGMNNLYGEFYDVSSKVLNGTNYIDYTNQSSVLAHVQNSWPEEYSAIAAVFGAPLGSKYESPDQGGEAVEQTDEITVSFRLIGATQSESGEYNVAAGIKDSEYINWIKTRYYVMEKGDTVGTLFARALGDAGLKYIGLGGNYISSIYAPAVFGGYKLGEFDNGFRSGWMYTVNGPHPGVGLNDCKLRDGDKVVWHYINDYSYECSDWFDDPDYPNLGDASTWDPWLTVPDIDPNAVNAVPEKKVDEVKKTEDGNVLVNPGATVKDGEAKAEVSAKNAADAIAAAKKDDAKAIVIAPEVKGGTNSVAVSVPTAAAKEMAAEKDIDLNVETSAGNVSVPAEALASIAQSAEGSDIAINVAVKEESDVKDESVDTSSGIVLAVTVTSGGKQITSFGGKSITIDIPVDNKYVEGRTYSVVQISADGSKQTLDGKCLKIGDKLYVRVSVSHLSTFVVLGGRQMKFVDVANHWAKAGIQYVFDRGIMSGTAETKFAPDARLSRAMLVTMLHNLEGAPKPGSAAAFTDVEAGKWYADAISWAAANGIVSGVGEGKFAPNDNITREQIATILHNYAKYNKYDVTKTGDISVFADSADISDWALPALKWANGAGLIKGRTKSTMVPKGIATRAEAAVIITFFLENVVK